MATKLTDSVFESVKKLVNANGDDYFDDDLLIHINTVFSVLNQLGVGDGIEIDKKSTWDEITEDEPLYNMIKSYVVLRVRILFDMPSSSFMLDTMKEQARELEWRIATAKETEKLNEESNEQFDLW